jgi:hypothetical protein
MNDDTPKPNTTPSSFDLMNALGTEGIAVSASELIELIRSGNNHDVNELVRRTLSERQAA